MDAMFVDDLRKHLEQLPGDLQVVVHVEPRNDFDPICGFADEVVVRDDHVRIRGGNQPRVPAVWIISSERAG